MVFTFGGGLCIVFLNDITKKAFPKFEFLGKDKDDLEPKQTKINKVERRWYIFCIGFLSFFVGTALSFYWFGFKPNEIPNFYQRGFWSMIVGFLTPQLLLHLQGLNISIFRKWL